jgi:aminomethyltransferase
MEHALKRTPLYDTHRQLGARLIEFGGWEMPVQYTGIVEEHHAVRNAAGIFDISHMGEFLVSGPPAAEFLNRVFTNDVHKLQPGQGQYTLMCNEGGGVVDDLYVFMIGKDQFLLIVNASRIEPDFAWMQRQKNRFHQAGQVHLENASDQYGAVAVQGPRIGEFMDRCLAVSGAGEAAVIQATEMRKNQIVRSVVGGVATWVSRTGYTGEDGFEVVAPADGVERVWQAVWEAGREVGLKPAGLGARDTLRMEACYPLYGHELDEQTTPIEAGLGRFVSLPKPEFIGRAVLARQAAQGTAKKLVAFLMTEKAPPPRPSYEIYLPEKGAEPVGKVCSGTMSPSLGVGAGMGYVTSDWAKPGTAIAIGIRGGLYPARIMAKPLYRKPAKSE